MEKEELELIMRLKNTKLLEDQAYIQLEQARKDPIEQSVQLSQTSKRGTGKQASNTRVGIRQ